jgi:hypothetical protein
MKNIILSLCFAVFFTGCADLFEPAIENHPNKETMYSDAKYAQGILLNGYTRIPTGSWSFNDVATDDAVSNDKNNVYMKMATGQWASNNNPVDQWHNAYAAIQYINIMLEESDKVQWAVDENAKRMFNDRIKGEAYGLRGLYMYHLLKAHAGWGSNGELLGAPILTASQSTEADFNQPRVDFEKCMQRLYDDLDKAEELLPLDYEDISDEAQVPAKYVGITKEEYNRVFGKSFRQRITSRIVKGVRAQAALLAASPAYSQGNTTTWADAANAAAEVLDLIGGVSGLAPKGTTWYYNASEINGLDAGSNPAEILWRTGIENSRYLEEDNYPPTLYGNGRVNPTQNLVDAFPMKNGYPIEDVAKSGYDAQDPYYNRDPRLAQYIIYNGNAAGPTNKKIWTELDDPDNMDALNVTERSTRTGYYMKKLLRQDVNLNPVGINEQRHYKPHIRYTEIFLIYAEAANEAWGPDGKGSHHYSARDVMKAIRQRAGVGKTNDDAYLASLTNQDEMRKLIRNERRLELCFEGIRFWDLRRWKEDLTATACGIRIKDYEYTPIEVENRNYKDYMYYGPIPYGEILKWNRLEQNKDWK